MLTDLEQFLGFLQPVFGEKADKVEACPDWFSSIIRTIPGDGVRAGGELGGHDSPHLPALNVHDDQVHLLIVLELELNIHASQKRIGGSGELKPLGHRFVDTGLRAHRDGPGLRRMIPAEIRKGSGVREYMSELG